MFTVGVCLRPQTAESGGGAASAIDGGTGTGGNYVPPTFLIMNLIGVYVPPVGTINMNLS